MSDSESNGYGSRVESGRDYTAVFDTRISQLERGQRDLSTDISQLGGQFERSLKAAIDSFGRQMDALSSKVDERSKIPWPALGVMLSFITVIGGLVWYPVKTQQDALTTAITRLSEAAVTKSDMEFRFQVAGQRRDDFQRQAEARSAENTAKIEGVRERVVPRSELEEKWRANDIRTQDIQRQLEELKRSFGDTFSLRDALQMMQKRVDSIESIAAAAQKK